MSSTSDADKSMGFFDPGQQYEVNPFHNLWADLLDPVSRVTLAAIDLMVRDHTDLLQADAFMLMDIMRLARATRVEDNVVLDGLEGLAKNGYLVARENGWYGITPALQSRYYTGHPFRR